VGVSWISAEEACRLLERARSTVNTYAREGFFRSKLIRTGGAERHLLCCREDILEIAAIGVKEARRQILRVKRKARESRPRCHRCTAVLEEVGESQEPGLCLWCYRDIHNMPSLRREAYRDVIEGRIR